MSSPDYLVAEQQQDALRPLRMFVSFAGAMLGDQTYAGTDGYTVNTPGQFQVYGPYGASVEGQPVAITQSGGVVISPAVVLIGLGVAAALLWKR